MKRYSLLIKQLREKGIEFETGLNEQEFTQIEEVYGFQFPISYKRFLMEGVPISSGFYNWRDFTPVNVRNIQNKMKIPFLDIKNYCHEIDRWPTNFGKNPMNEKEIEEKITILLEKAPKLIPVFSHRYIPMTSIENPPIFSIVGLDIIYYGEDLFQYLEIEFGILEHSAIQHKNIKYVEFWSETINW